MYQPVVPKQRQVTNNVENRTWTRLAMTIRSLISNIGLCGAGVPARGRAPGLPVTVPLVRSVTAGHAPQLADSAAPTTEL